MQALRTAAAGPKQRQMANIEASNHRSRARRAGTLSEESEVLALGGVPPAPHTGGVLHDSWEDGVPRGYLPMAFNTPLSPHGTVSGGLPSATLWSSRMLENYGTFAALAASAPSQSHTHMPVHKSRRQ